MIKSANRILCAENKPLGSGRQPVAGRILPLAYRLSQSIQNLPLKLLPSIMNVKDIIAIDTHSHYNTGSEFDTKTDATYSADLDFLRKTSQNAKIGPIFASTFSSVLNRREVVSENNKNFLAAQKYPWLYQWVVVEPDNDESFAQADRVRDDFGNR
jgi:hypothetical protein